MKLPVRYSHLLFGGLLSAIMVTIISGTVLLINRGYGEGFLHDWLQGFATAWPVAFPTVLVVAPLVRRVVSSVTV